MDNIAPCSECGMNEIIARECAKDCEIAKKEHCHLVSLGDEKEPPQYCLDKGDNCCCQSCCTCGG